MKTSILAALAALILSGCASANLTPESVRARCWSASDPECFNVCDAYRDAVADVKFTGKKQCRETCTALHQRLASENAINRCERSAANGMDLCNQYCNQNFGGD
ncbi:MAG: hypothetical protein HQK81_05050 [Desulfovibrionaceae bacterium]|nr:hypothetical protein [Desulfovibrionaceae bacterium]MBF0513413.1 hypothetical protein [Desulfovibrionaceae bacterium]